MDINDVFNIVKYRASKAGYSGYISPDDFKIVFNKAQLRYFNKMYAVYAGTQRSSDSLSKFVAPPTALTLTAGTGNLATLTNLLHITAVTYQNKEVHRVEADRLANHLSSSYDAPSAEFPIYIQYDTTIQVYPNNITPVDVMFLRAPVEVVWGYTINNSNPDLPRLIYDPANSVQPEWSDLDLDNIVYMMLADIGVNTKDTELENFAQLSISQEQ